MRCEGVPYPVGVGVSRLSVATRYYESPRTVREAQGRTGGCTCSTCGRLRRIRKLHAAAARQREIKRLRSRLGETVPRGVGVIDWKQRALKQKVRFPTWRRTGESGEVWVDTTSSQTMRLKHPCEILLDGSSTTFCQAIRSSLSQFARFTAMGVPAINRAITRGIVPIATETSIEVRLHAVCLTCRRSGVVSKSFSNYQMAAFALSNMGAIRDEFMPTALRAELMTTEDLRSGAFPAWPLETIAGIGPETDKEGTDPIRQ
jgi:hypothetical protein